MNKIFWFVYMLVLTLVIVYDSAIAQEFPTDKGSKTLSGSFVFSSAGGDLYEATGDDLVSGRLTLIRLSPSIGYFVTPGLLLGGQFMLERVAQGNVNKTIWGTLPGLAYFIGGNQPKSTVKGTIYPYLSVALGYLRSTSEEPLRDALGELMGILEITASGPTIVFGGGICYMLSNTVGLSGGVGYQIDNMKTEDWVPPGREGVSGKGSKFNIIIEITAFLY